MALGLRLSNEPKMLSINMYVSIHQYSVVLQTLQQEEWKLKVQLTMNPDHRFAFASLAQVPSWCTRVRIRENADLTKLFKIAAHKANKFRAQNRLLRVVTGTNYVCKARYLQLNDSLADALEHVSEHEGYIYESVQGHSRARFHLMHALLSHPHKIAFKKIMSLVFYFQLRTRAFHSFTTYLTYYT
ncbi:hypothetical protein MKW94_024896 [Papaver nudicaule]|uniref:Uncharacterized protein n=1 Tax=Papaver nudicaule TaxID=74823 RepID=A0AA41S591_PAPNU|nr:hypothetical protein [Papaver nudicaule]